MAIIIQVMAIIIQVNLLASTQARTEGFVAAKFYDLHALVDIN